MTLCCLLKIQNHHFITGGRLNEDFCGVEPVTHPPEPVETRPPPGVDLQRELDFHKTDEAILGSKYFYLLLREIIGGGNTHYTDSYTRYTYNALS